MKSRRLKVSTARLSETAKAKTLGVWDTTIRMARFKDGEDIMAKST